MLTIGEFTYGHESMQIKGDMNNVTIGKYCSIGDNLIIDGGFQHRTDFITTYPFHNRMGIGVQNAFTRGDVTIGNDVWIGQDVMIMGGVKIHDGAVIGARSVVTRDVGPYEVVAGVPAKHIKYRVTPFIASQLLKIKWWEWEPVKIMAEIDLLTSGDITAFVKKHTV